MNLPGFSALMNAWWFLLLVPLIIFYFLKLRRPRMEIPSLALWRQVVNDQRVNSPFQKFKRNLLLLLQILLLCALILGAMQPYLSSGAEQARYLPVLIDNSASMASLDGPNGKSRLDEAKDRVSKLIDDLLPDQRLCLISVSGTARKLTDFTDNKRLLRDALSKLEVSQVASRLEDGLRMAQAMSRVQPIDNVVLISDGNVPQEVDFELPYKLTFQKLGYPDANVGIVDFNARRSRTGWDVFARIEGTKQPEGSKGPPTAKTLCEYELLQNGQLIKQDTVSIDGGQAERLVFKVSTAVATSLELRIKPDGTDSLSSDNVAFLEIPAPRPLTVFCPPRMESYRNALATMPDITLYPGEGTEPKVVDLKFAEGPISTGPEARVTVNVGFVPDDLSNLVELVSGQTEVVDWRRTAPLLQHVQLLDVQIADDPQLAKGISERDFEQAGYEILAQSRSGPLILERLIEGRWEYYFLFNTDRSSLVYRVGFPILIQNATQIAAQQANLLDSKAHPTGTLPPQRITPETEIHVSGPHGYTETAKSDKDGFLSGIAAPYVGAYELTGDTQPIKIGASLLSTTETSLNAVEKLHFPEVSVAATTVIVKTDQPLWGWFAAAALGFLMLEWWYFQKRPAGVLT
ncbi:vWA domain-containing protein [Schlesneria paludicola]|uniref:vWA domain-containing protein n=1 Tax=Schlesneria paludicola TaxID=360056 RepID=UPI00029A7247|nr:BatA and WFA domain-containing protein [Schlesneria paludicola]